MARAKVGGVHLTAHESLVIWRRAFDLYCEGRTMKEVADHPDIPYGFSMVQKKCASDKWSKRRKDIIAKRDDKLAVAKDMQESAATLAAIEAKDTLWQEWTFETKQKVLDMVRLGKPLKTALAMYGFKKEDRAKLIGQDKVFIDEAESALAEFEAFLLDKIVKHTDKNYKAAFDLLKAHPDLRDKYTEKQDRGGIQIHVTFQRESIPLGTIVDVQAENVVTIQENEVKELPRAPRLEVYKPKPPTPEEILDRSKQRADHHNEQLRKEIAKVDDDG